MVRQTIVPTIGCVILLGLLGCCEARLVMRDQYGGVVAIPNNTDRWPTYNRKNAEELMAKQCPEGFIIESESEVQTGQKTVVQTGPPRDASYSVVVAGAQSQEVTTEQLTEYRIVFRSKNAPKTIPSLKEGPIANKGLVPLVPPAPPELSSGAAIMPTSGQLPPQPIPVNQ